MPKAKNLKHLRKINKLTQEMFADIIGVSRGTVIAWENKKRAIPMPSAKRIAEHFNVDYFDFCDIDMEDRSKETTGYILERVTHEEWNYLSKLRKLNTKTKSIVIAALDAAFESENQ